MRNISIFGSGRLGGALALALDTAGYIVEVLIYRGNRPSPELTAGFQRPPKIATAGDIPYIASEIVLITTQDSEIESASRQVSRLVTGPSKIFITSGALASTSIGHLRDRGCFVGSFHPLVSVADPIVGSQRFKNAFFCLEGDPDAIATAELIVSDLQGHSFSVPTDKKPLYHAAAVTSSGHLVALIDIAIGLHEKCGLEREKAKKILLPLIESTWDNVKERGIEGSLTGTFARGDSETFIQHLESLRNNASRDQIETFLRLGLHSIEIAERMRRDSPSLEDLRKRVSMAQRELR